MSESGESPRHPFCRHIRTKAIYCAVDLVEAEEAILNSSTYQNFWCQHTMTDTGPDDRFVAHDRCRPGRVCYEPIEG